MVCPWLFSTFLDLWCDYTDHLCYCVFHQEVDYLCSFLLVTDASALFDFGCPDCLCFILCIPGYFKPYTALKHNNTNTHSVTLLILWHIFQPPHLYIFWFSLLSRTCVLRNVFPKYIISIECFFCAHYRIKAPTLFAQMSISEYHKHIYH